MRHRIPPPPTKYGPSRQVQPRAGAPAPGRSGLAPPAVKFGRLAATSGAVQAASADPAPDVRARKLTTLQIEQLFANLSKTWRTLMSAGSLDASIGLASSGKHACSAVGTWDSMQQGKIPGHFSAEHLHAEMDVMEKVFLDGTEVEVAKVEIETQPCPRCAVILNLLGLGPKVSFKKAGGLKDYPTWRFPDLWLSDDKLAEMLGVPADIDSHAKAEILKLFRTHKWW